MMPFAALYIRTALADIMAYDLQLQACRDHLPALGLAEAAVFADSGRAAPARARIMREATAGAFDVIVVASLDRLSRDPSELFALSEELCSLGMEIHVAGVGSLAPMEGGLRALGGQPGPHRVLRIRRRARSLASGDRRGEVACDPSSALSIPGAAQ